MSPENIGGRRKWAGGLAGIALAAVFFYGVLVWPNDRRAGFRFPDLRNPGPARAAAFDFLARAAEARVQSEAQARGRSLLQQIPSVNARRAYHGSPFVVQVSLGWAPLETVRRRALYAPPPTTYEYDVTVPADAVLSLGCGVLSRPDAVDGGVRFAVEADLAGRTHSVFTRDISQKRRFPLSPDSRLYRWFFRPFDVGLKARGDRWHLETVDLGLFEGKRIRLRFRTESLRRRVAATDGPASHGFWAEPVLWTVRPASASRPDNVVLIVWDNLRWDALASHGASRAAAPQTDAWMRRGADFQRMFTNAVVPRFAMASLLTSRPITRLGPAAWAEAPAALDKERFYRKKFSTLAQALRSRGYRTAAVGAAEGTGAGLDWGFDEVHAFDAPGYGLVHACQRAADWLADHRGREPFFLMVYLKDPSRDARVPWAYWLRTMTEPPWTAEARARWAYRAKAAYVDAYAGRLLSVLEALKLEETSLISILSTRGQGLRPRPRVSPGGRPVWRVAAGPGAGLTNDDIRAVWSLRHRTIRPGELVYDPAQLLDVAPTLLELLKIPRPAGFGGSAKKFPARPPSPTEAPPVLAFGEKSKAIVFEGHFKYIRHERRPEAREFRAPASEELYDLWADPEERDNLVRRRRTLLARLRRHMDQWEPDPVETRLIFWDLGSQAVRGTVQVAGGVLRASGASGESAGSGQAFQFTIQASSGEARFQTWPPSASHTVQLRVDQRPFTPDQVRVSKFGLPFFDRSSVEWFDAVVYPWMEGVAEPRAGDRGPLVYWGRVPASGSFLPWRGAPGGEEEDPSEDPREDPAPAPPAVPSIVPAALPLPATGVPAADVLNSSAPAEAGP